MTASFELMELESGNLVGSYLTLEEALAIVRDAYAAYGLSGVDDLGLVRVERDGAQQFIAAGRELFTHALRSPVVLRVGEQARSSGEKSHARSRRTGTD